MWVSASNAHFKTLLELWTGIAHWNLVAYQIAIKIILAPMMCVFSFKSHTIDMRRTADSSKKQTNNARKKNGRHTLNETSPINIAWLLALFSVRFNFSTIRSYFLFCYPHSLFSFSVCSVVQPNDTNYMSIIVFLDHVRWLIDSMGLNIRNHFSALESKRERWKNIT